MAAVALILSVTESDGNQTTDTQQEDFEISKFHARQGGLCLVIGEAGTGKRSAIIYSIVVSCQRHGKDPLAYLRHVHTRLPAMTTNDDLALLLPANWSAPA